MARSTAGMVSAAQPLATRAGVRMLERGGNAADAAVATAFALAVTDAHHSGLGGGGFLLIRLPDGRAVALDARETAPAAAARSMYVEEGVAEDASRVGALAVATPGLLLGLATALERYGTLSLPQAMAPAIRLAEEGFAVGPRHAATVRFWQERLGLAERFPETARIHLPPPDEGPIEAGWVLRQPELARTLRRIAAEGPEVFYRGAVGRAIVDEVRRRGGILSMEDLASYRVRERAPIRGRYRGLEVLSFPPPSSGGIALVQMLNVLEGFDLAARGPRSSATIHVVAEAMKLAFADRAAWLGDTDFVDVPVERLVSEAYAAELRRRIDPPWWRRAPWTWHRDEVAITVEGSGIPADGGGTTHLSVADAEGGAVAITQTINLIFGSGITVPGTGIVLNDEMDDFSVAPDVPNAFGLVDTRGQNAVAPRKRPLSSMTPTVVLKDGRPFMVTGSPGGPRIITTTLLSILNVVDHGMDVMEAVSAPRWHHQWLPDRLLLEPQIPADVARALRERGHPVEISEREWSSAQSVVVLPDGTFSGASDPRSDGVALGPDNLPLPGSS
ncbi:MAG: gamma-glutamyltransferase, partial [Myxococcota bacterium]|nr:gamma-glutamyltransferase [Myxococcota bacterium]